MVLSEFPRAIVESTVLSLPRSLAFFVLALYTSSLLSAANSAKNFSCGVDQITVYHF